MRKFVKAFSDVLQSGFVKEDSIKRHIEQQAKIDRMLPDSDSFFFVLELRTQIYHFLGKQQESISGYTNEEFQDQGIELFLKCLHPEEIDIILNKIYKDLMKFVADTDPVEKKNLLFRYNYRFRRKDNTYVNLFEQVNILETDDKGLATLVLGNVFLIDTEKLLPLQAAYKKIRSDGLLETVFSKNYCSRENAFSNITNREMDILRSLALGNTSKDIAKELNISPHTVDTHRRNLLKKLDCKSVIDLVRLAFKNALL